MNAEITNLILSRERHVDSSGVTLFKLKGLHLQTVEKVVVGRWLRNNTNRRLSRKQRTRLEREEFLREKRRHSLSSLVSHHVLRVKEEEIIVSLKIHLSFRERSLKF